MLKFRGENNVTLVAEMNTMFVVRLFPTHAQNIRETQQVSMMQKLLPDDSMQTTRVTRSRLRAVEILHSLRSIRAGCLFLERKNSDEMIQLYDCKPSHPMSS